MLTRRWLGLVGFAAVSGFAASATATTSAVRLEYIQRQLVLPEGTMRFDAGPHWPDYDSQLKHVVIRGSSNLDYLNPGLTFGVVEDLEVGAIAPLLLSPDLDVEDPRLHALFQFQRGDVDLGLYGELRLGFFDQWRLTGGVPIQWDLSRSVRLDTGGFLELVFGDGSSMNLIVPAQLPIQLSRSLYVGVESGVEFYSLFDDNSGVALPLGGFIGYTFGKGAGTVGDLYARVRLHDIENGFDVVSLMVGTELYFDM